LLLRPIQLCGIIPPISTASGVASDRERGVFLTRDFHESKGVIVYNLGCPNDHHFEGWFASLAEYERQSESRLLSCPLCGSEDVSRIAHAPYVSTGAAPREEQRGTGSGRAAPALPQQYANLTAEFVSNVIETVLEKTVDVGRAFPEEARRIHYNEAPERAIRGTATDKEVEALRDEGIEVMSLPVPPHRLVKAH
jgi:hypothetical protein